MERFQQIRVTIMDAQKKEQPIRETTEEILKKFESSGAQDAEAPRGECPAASDLAKFIDHTLLKPDATESQIRQLCKEAAQFGFATVCVNPVWVGLCSQLLRGTDVGVCAVAGFPLGASTADVKAYEARRAICSLRGRDHSLVKNGSGFDR